MLTQLAWEEELGHGPFAAPETWSRTEASGDLHLDFSVVEFADFGALAGALLLLDVAVRCRIPATVTLPTASVSTADGQGDQAAAGPEPTSAARQAWARGNARAFMRQVGFIGSLQAPHWDPGAVQVLDQVAAEAVQPGSVARTLDPDLQGSLYRRRRAFPFRWLEPMPAARKRASDSFRAVSAGLEDLGLSRSDARTMSQTVLTELVESVAEHGNVGNRPPVALVGAILLSAETYMFRQDGMHPRMVEVAERAMADGSRVLRLIAADSSADPVTRVAGNPPVSTQEASGRQGTTSLWWLERVVRSYRGGVQERTADRLIGKLFGRTPDGTVISETGLGHIPGTLLDLTIPTGARPRRPRVLWGSQSISGAVPRLQWTNCAFDPQRGLGDADRVRLADLARVPATDGQPSGLVVTIPVQDVDHAQLDDGWRHAIHLVLEFMSSIASSTVIVVVFPDAEPHTLDPCLAAFNEELAVASGESEHAPIVVLGCRGDPVWCGGSPPLRAVLSALSGEGGTVNLTAARKSWLWAGGESARFSHAIRASERLLSSVGRKLQLRLSPSVVHGAVEQAANQGLAGAIDRGSDGVESGTFRGPTLRITRRWVDVEQLLAGTVGMELAAFALARKVEAALRQSPPPEAPTAVVQVASAPRPLARHLSECLSLGGRYYPQPSELDIGEPPTGERLSAGAKVVLCTDLISTENTVRRAAATVAADGADPIVIACVVDTRDTRGPVQLLNRTIPVVSLTEVEIGSHGTEAERAATDIDPLLLRPEVAPAQDREAPVQDSDLFQWFGADPDVFRLGHIDDPPHRHYSAFIRLHALRQQETRDQISAAVLLHIKQSFAEIRAQASPDLAAESPIAIWYVASDGNAGQLADIVRELLSAEGIEVSAVTPIPRWASGDSWAFPARIDQVDRPMAVVIIHWWAITGSTLLQLVRLAARSGASSIAAVCMLNQLDANDADALRMLRAVSVPAADADTDPHWAANGSRPSALIPVAIRFVAVSSITALDAHGCAICATRKRYQLEDEDAPSRLIRHSELLHDVLRPRELEEVSRDSAADLFNVPVTGDEVIDYLRWRRLLLRAIREVRGRQEVIDRLRALTAEPASGLRWTSVGLIRLLSAEQQWLRLPPLHLGVARDLLAQVCVNGIQQLTAPPWLRVQALLVMSAAAPQRLVEQLPRLLTWVGDEAVLVDQLLLDCRRLLRRQPGDSPVDIAQLRQNLMECRDYLEERRTAPDNAAGEDHLHAVKDIITIADYRILPRPKDAQAAWDRLREDLVRPVVRHRLEAELLLVRNFVEDLEQVEPSPESAWGVGVDWDTCARQLEERALANLPPLRDILAGDFVSDWLGSRDQRRLLTLAQPDLRGLRAVTNRLHELAHGSWRPDDAIWQGLRRELLDRINWWNRMFLAAHIPDHHVPALLVGLIQSAPVKRLRDHVESLLDQHQAQVAIAHPENGDVSVFCPEKLLDQIVAHLIENLSRHRIPGADCRLHVEYSTSSADTVEFVMRNSGTRACTPPGQGIKALNDKLRPFGGSLVGHVLAENEWTFAAVARLPVWHGG